MCLAPVLIFHFIAVSLWLNSLTSAPGDTGGAYIKHLAPVCGTILLHHFSYKTPFFNLKEQLIDKLSLFMLCLWEIPCWKKWTKWSCHFKEWKPQKLALILKFKISRENENFEKLTSAIVWVDSFLIPKNFFDEVGGTSEHSLYLVQ